MLTAAESVDRYGMPGGPLVIALHGAVANRKTWLPLTRVLRSDLELWCPDLSGHGLRADGPFEIESSLSLVRELLARAAPRRTIVAGDSLGGYLALLAAARDHDARISGVCAGGCTWTMTGASGMLARASDAPVRLLQDIVGEARLVRLAARILPRLCDAETARAIMDAGLRLRARPESLAQLAGFDLAATVRAIAAPIAIVNGERDWPTRAGEGTVLRNARSATVTLARNTGHGVGFLAPAVFARAIESLV